MISFSEQEEAAFKNAGFAEFEDGLYKGIFKSAEIKLVGQQRNKKLVLTYEIISPPELSGKNYKHFLPLDNSNAFGFLKMTLAKFGCSLQNMKLADVEPEMKRLAEQNLEVEFLLTTDGKYQNANIESVEKSWM